MQTKGRKTVIGAFVVGAVALLVAGVLLLGSGKFFSVVRQAALYFDEPVAGLAVGAPVQFRGVKIGQVISIQMLANMESLAFKTRVIFEYYPETFMALDEKWQPLSASSLAGASLKHQKGENLAALIKRGLRAQLQVQSMVTGQLMVALDMYPDAPLQLSGLTSDTFEIPTILSSREKLSRTLANVPFAEIATDLRDSLKGIDQLINSEDTKESVHNLRTATQQLSEALKKIDEGIKPILDNSSELLRETRGLVKKVDERVAPMADGMGVVLDDAHKVMGKLDAQVEPLGTRLKATLDSATEALSEISGLLGSLMSQELRQTGITFEIRNALRSVSGAMDALKGLGSYLQEHPEALIKGKAGN